MIYSLLFHSFVCLLSLFPLSAFFASYDLILLIALFYHLSDVSHRLERRKNSLVLNGGICSKRGFVDFKVNDQRLGLSAQVDHDTNRCVHSHLLPFLTF
jgi:hypothetical protein